MFFFVNNVNEAQRWSDAKGFLIYVVVHLVAYLSRTLKMREKNLNICDDHYNASMNDGVESTINNSQ